jgi:RNA polymerase sigma factor (sigma-70 family)
MALMLETTSLAHVCGDAELIAAARNGDDSAFEQLYARYYDRINAFIRGRIRDHGRAEDIAQEVFMSALRRLRTSEQSISFRPWIYEIAKNACIDEFRRGKRAREVSLDAEDELTGGPRALRAVTPTPPVALEGKQRLDDLRGAFGGLSENHHRLLVLRELEGLCYDEIGRRTGMSRSMVESALFRARRKLTEEYEELASGRRCQQVQVVIADGRAQSAPALGARERRQLARHLAHCQPCRIVARLAGVDEALLKPRSTAAKIAALLPIPLPLWRWPWGGSARARNALVQTGAHPLAHQAPAATDAAGPAASVGGAAIAAAVIALAGAGGAVVSAVTHHAHPGSAAERHVVVSTPPPAHQHPARVGSGVASGGTQETRSSAAPRAGRTISGTGRTQRAATRAARHTTSSAAGNSPFGGSTLQTVSRAGSAAPGLAKTAGSSISHASSGVTSTVHHVVNTVTGTVNSTTSSLNSTLKSTTSSVNSTLKSTTSSLNNTLKSTASTLGSTTSQLTSPTGSSAPTGSTLSTSTSTSTTSSSPVSTLTGTVKQVVPGLLH